MLTVYGIKQCDTCRKALRWLVARDIDHQFHDFRVDGLREDLVAAWLESPFAEKLVNRRSTTWRQLTQEQRQSKGAALVKLLLAHPTLIKRPVFVKNAAIVVVGFDTSVLEGL